MQSVKHAQFRQGRNPLPPPWDGWVFTHINLWREQLRATKPASSVANPQACEELLLPSLIFKEEFSRVGHFPFPKNFWEICFAPLKVAPSHKYTVPPRADKRHLQLTPTTSAWEIEQWIHHIQASTYIQRPMTFCKCLIILNRMFKPEKWETDSWLKTQLGYLIAREKKDFVRNRKQSSHRTDYELSWSVLTKSHVALEQRVPCWTLCAVHRLDWPPRRASCEDPPELLWGLPGSSLLRNSGKLTSCRGVKSAGFTYSPLSENSASMCNKYLNHPEAEFTPSIMWLVFYSVSFSYKKSVILKPILE